jgi:hypothetical protein
MVIIMQSYWKNEQILVIIMQLFVKKAELPICGRLIGHVMGKRGHQCQVLEELKVVEPTEKCVEGSEWLWWGAGPRQVTRELVEQVLNGQEVGLVVQVVEDKAVQVVVVAVAGLRTEICIRAFLSANINPNGNMFQKN